MAHVRSDAWEGRRRVERLQDVVAAHVRIAAQAGSAASAAPTAAGPRAGAPYPVCCPKMLSAAPEELCSAVAVTLNVVAMTMAYAIGVVQLSNPVAPHPTVGLSAARPPRTTVADAARWAQAVTTCAAGVLVAPLSHTPASRASRASPPHGIFLGPHLAVPPMAPRPVKGEKGTRTFFLT